MTTTKTIDTSPTTDVLSRSERLAYMDTLSYKEKLAYMQTLAYVDSCAEDSELTADEDVFEHVQPINADWKDPVDATLTLEDVKEAGGLEMIRRAIRHITSTEAVVSTEQHGGGVIYRIRAEGYRAAHA